MKEIKTIHRNFSSLEPLTNLNQVEHQKKNTLAHCLRHQQLTKKLIQTQSVTPRPERSMRGNHRVSLDEPQLPETHPRTRKSFSTITRLKNRTLVLSLIKSKNGNLINQTKILPKIWQNSVCNKDYPLPRNINKSIYTKCIHPSMGYSSSYKS